MTVLRTRIAIIFAIALALVLVPIAAHATSTNAVLNFNGEVDCVGQYPDHPIKGMTYDVRSGSVTTQCYTQTYWDMNMIGGQVFEDFKAAVDRGSDMDVTAIIADWKAEKASIEALRVDAEARAQAEADTRPGDVICKAWSYTSRYNGSGGGSVCKVNNNPVDVSVKHPVVVPATPSTDTVVSESLSAVTPAAARYFAKAAATPRFTGTKLKFTLPKAPKGTRLTVFKSVGSDCSLKGRVVKASTSGTCELTMTITKNGSILGTQKLTLTRG